ncbi:MAG: nucleotidyltransferase [Deltaproteobacteria bacterium]|nr:nucleotidyltransferase [Deltaproteobacteria bacterium]
MDGETSFFGLIPFEDDHQAIDRSVQDILFAARRQTEDLSINDRKAVFTELGRLSYAETKKITAFQMEVDASIWRIDKAGCLDDIAAAHARLNALVLVHFQETLIVSDLQAICTSYRDFITAKIIDLVEAEMRTGFGYMPCDFAWIGTGSEGRGEQTLLTDQDNLVVYQEDSGHADEYFAAFSEKVVDYLERVGFNRCTGAIMASNPKWRGSLLGWRHRMSDLMLRAFQDNRALLDLIILLDSRFIGGHRTLAEEFIDEMLANFDDRPGLVREIARSAMAGPVALGMFHRFRTEGSGPHKNKMNIKMGGWAPLILTVRVFALLDKIRDVNTVKKIKMLEKSGRLSSDMSRRLEESFYILTKHKLLQQIDMIKAGRHKAYFDEHDHFVDPTQLDKESSEKLKQALRNVQKLQDQIVTTFHLQSI